MPTLQTMIHQGKFVMSDLIWHVSMVETGYLVRETLEPRVRSNLTCMLGGRLLNNDTIVNIGLELADACWNTYASTAYVALALIFSPTSDFS
jgi:hypothetical protein